MDRGCEGKGHGCGQLWALKEMLEKHIMLVCYHCLSPMLDDRLDREERGGQTQQSRQVILPHFTKMRPHTMFSSKAKEEEEKSHGHENWHGGFIVIPKKSVLFLIFYSVLPYSFSDFFSLSHLFVKPTARRLLFPISFLLYGAKKIWNRVVLCFHSVHEHVSSVFFSLGEYPSGILSPHLERRLPHTCTYSWN